MLNYITATNKNCQSCGMPLNKEEKGRGSNADGSKNKMYCSHCYENGEFTMPDITVEQMQEIVKEKIRMVGFPRFHTGFFTTGIPKLERWKTK